MGMRSILAAALVAVQLGAPLAAGAETPQRGGTLVFGVGGEPNTLDCHATNTFAVLHYVAPHYSTLLRYDPEAYPRIVGDVAASWTSSDDRLTWTFRLREDVVFHDGTPLTATDVKATLERLRTPPPGVVSVRKAQFSDIAAIETPDSRTLIVTLAAFDASFEAKMASPWNCIYSAARLASDPEYPHRRVMGTGPFVFADYQQGKAWNGRRFDRYHHAGQPYLDGFQAVPVEGPSMVNALAAGHLQAEFRGVTPAQRDRIIAARGDKVRFHEGDRISVYVVALNTQRPPFDDVRVRRALTLALDRRAGQATMTRISSVRTAGGFLRPGSPMAATPAELAAAPGFGPDVQAARVEARRLLAEAGQGQLKVRLISRSIENPHQQIAVFLIDQWRQIGVTTDHQKLETGPWQATLQAGNFDAITDFSADPVDDPTIQLERFTSFDRAPNNASRAIDRTLDDLFERQRRSADPAARRELVRRFEDRLLEQAYTIPLFWAVRIIPVASEVQGWPFSPSHFLFQDLATVWIRK
ncbi:MAG: ABC transporter substrate-binding protein [Alphaproteobacteria bacterium]|nr:ABC transporter substrate-binding protein [Alphaproteobacteria bacterium]